MGSLSLCVLSVASSMANSSSSSHGCNILLLLLSIYLLKLTALFSHATSTLFPNQTITDGESRISPNKTYELGFFSPDGSSNRFVGIWYHNLPVQTVVWVANRERPIPDFSGFITFDSQGNLIVKNGFGSSSVIASNTGMTNLTTIVLLDSGNLILRDWTSSGKGKVLWQSFDNPTDTFLPGMKLGVDGRQNRVITSWTSPQDPSPGEFTLGIDPNGTKQFFIWRRGEVYWTSGVWNGEQFRFVSQKAEPYFHYLSYVSNWSGGYYSYFLKDSSIITRAVIDFTGQLKRSAWLEDKWVVFFVQPAMVACEVPDYCGANGLCNNNTIPPCSCLLGFEPNAKDQWDLGSKAGGCKRESLLKCGDGDGFLRLRNVKLPLFYLSTGNSSAGLEDCKAKCSSNCSCTAYALANGNGNGCLLWFGDLMGLQQSSDALQDLYVRLAASELNQASDHVKKRVVLILISVAGAVIIFLLSASICYFRWRKNSEHEEGEQGSDCSLFSFATIATATNNFSSSNKLGEGGFGPVYKAVLEGQTVAVKRLSKSSGQGLEEFKNEIDLISKLQHTNLVRLLGYCIQKEEKMLLYEYMPNKSLDSYIFDPVGGAQLDWAKRFHIIEGIAQGLLYLHKYSRLRIIHRDLKASNILLDSEMNPKISDFGIARIFGANENQANTRRVVGTFGYMSPEYAISGLFSVKSDVFSFGVLLLEIISGKKNTAFQQSESSAHLLGHAWQLWKEGREVELIDPSLGKMQSLHEALRSIHVALLCVQDSAADRPTMSVVVSMLSSEAAVLPTPKQPAFSLVRSLVERDFLSSSQGIVSPNGVTLTSLEGR